ncbi:MAG TPA: membrane protein insertase YidC, partial [Gammaproteobacteria bacterium]|nr:membrane protein insertase YidC [Gammaproteobacteria bacterium]
MDLQRTLILGGLAIVGYLLWQAWQEDFVQAPQMTPDAVHTSTAVPGSIAAHPTPTDVPSAPTPAAPNAAITPTSASTSPQAWIEVETDVLKLWIDPVGGNLVQADLLNYQQTLEGNSPDVRLLNSDPQSLYLAQQGLSSEAGPDSPLMGQAHYQAN